MITSKLRMSFPECVSPLFPQEADLAEIDDFVPHLPVFDCGDGRLSIPVDQRPLTNYFHKLGMFAFVFDRADTKYAIVLAGTPASLGFDYLPNSIGYRRQKSAPIAKFVLNLEEPLLGGRVTAWSPDEEKLELTDLDLVDLAPHLQSCIFNTNTLKNRWGRRLILTK